MKHEQPIPSDLLTIREAARRVNLTYHYVYRLCASGTIPRYRFGPKTIRVALSDLADYVRAHKEQ